MPKTKTTTRESRNPSPRKHAGICSPDVSLSHRQGKLKKILELPLELVIMIFCYLLPADLLAILHAADGDIVHFLTSHTAAIIWPTARANATREQVPPCPSFMNESQYTALLFENRCTTCDRQCRKIKFDCLVRCCNHCLENPALYRYVDYSESGLEFIESFVPLIYASDTSFYVPIAHWNDFHARLRSIQTAAVDRAKKMKDFCSELKMKQRARSQATKAVSLWWAAYAREKVMTWAAIRERRASTIVEKISTFNVLREQFFSLSSNERRDFYNLSIVKQTQEIGEHDWPKILNTIGEFFQQLGVASRYRIILLQLSHLYLDFIRMHPYPQLHPDFADICSFPWIKQAIDIHAHNGTRWGPGAAAGLQSYLPDRILQWQHDTSNALLRKIPHYIKHSSPIHTAYNLAIVWFKAKSKAHRFRGRIVQFPQVLRVRFVHARERKFDDGWGPVVHRYNALTEWPHAMPWLAVEEEIVFATKAVEVACEVVRKVGLNPCTALQADMDALNPRLVCTCKVPGFIFNWRSMIQHRYSCSGANLIVLNAVDTKQVVQIEKVEFDKMCLARRFYCTRCDAFQHTTEAICLGMDEHEQHCAERHGTDKLSFSWEPVSSWMRTDSDSGLRCLPYGKMRPRAGYLTTPGLVGHKINLVR